MQNNQQILVGVILMLVIILGFMLYDRHASRETLGEKAGQTIDRVTGEN